MMEEDKEYIQMQNWFIKQSELLAEGYALLKEFYPEDFTMINTIEEFRFIIHKRNEEYKPIRFVKINEFLLNAYINNFSYQSQTEFKRSFAKNGYYILDGIKVCVDESNN